MAAFYGQSAALVDYLSGLREPTVFTAFLRDSQREGYAAALRRHYGIQTFPDLEQRCWQHTTNRAQETARR